jgi:hypothetical protein
LARSDRPARARTELTRRVREVAIGLTSADGPVETSRQTLLALAELARRAPLPAGDLPLALYELRVFSQNGEDGVLAEILKRCGTTTEHFVEFGAARGVENNCVLLADVFGWSGLFIEGDPDEYGHLESKYRGNPRVTTKQALVTTANVEQLFAEAGVPDEPDVLSIDVDGPDYWLWNAIEGYRPRVVVVEYNAALGLERALVRPEAATGGWDGTLWFGASLRAFELLGRQKGYRLVHTDLSGLNAFFVRDELAGKFPDPAAVARRGPNYYLGALTHKPDPQNRPFLDVESGEESYL